VRERDVIAPYISEVVLPPDGVYFQNTAVVSRTVFLDRGYAVNRGIPPEAVAAVYVGPFRNTGFIRASLEGRELGREP